jgi:hypothetical protein
MEDKGEEIIFLLNELLRKIDRIIESNNEEKLENPFLGGD